MVMRNELAVRELHSWATSSAALVLWQLLIQNPSACCLNALILDTASMM